MAHPPTTFARRLVKFCQQRAAAVLSPGDAQLLQTYLLEALRNRMSPPRDLEGHDWEAIAAASGITAISLKTAARALDPGLDALRRHIKRYAARPKKLAPRSPKEKRLQDERTGKGAAEFVAGEVAQPKRRGRRPKPFIEFPASDGEPWIDPECFADALDLHMRRHGDSAKRVAKALENTATENTAAYVDAQTIQVWRRGLKIPRAPRSLYALEYIEKRYRLPPGYFLAKLPNTNRCTSAGTISGISQSERRRLAWHLPTDFDRRPLKEREEILEWVQRVVISGSTEYRRFQAAAMKQRYSIRFPGLAGQSTRARGLYRFCRDEDGALPDPDIAASAVDAPPQLAQEMEELLRFKTSTLTAFGYQRNGVWGEETASQKVEHLGLMFGALAAAPTGAIHGFGVPLKSLTFGLLVFPIVWDWYIQWRERRRGFYTAWEVDMLQVAVALTRAETGWLRQSPQIADRIAPIPSLITEHDIAAVRADWGGACERMYKHGVDFRGELTLDFH